MNRQTYKREVCSFLGSIWDESGNYRAVFFERLNTSKYICLFGAGEIGRFIADDLVTAGVKIDFFCDNNTALWGGNIGAGIKCISPHELEKYKDDVFVLITTGYFKEVEALLKSMGFKKTWIVTQLMIRNYLYWNNVSCDFVKSQLMLLIDQLEDKSSMLVVDTIVKNWFNNSEIPCSYNLIETGNQYFIPEIIKLHNNEVFVDAGAFDGDTIMRFLKRTDNQFRRIIAYELDASCHSRLLDTIKTLPDNQQNKIEIFNLGLYNTNAIIRYAANSTSSVINYNAGTIGEVVRLSDHQRNNKISFIKMDIEGAELEALQGAKEIISTFAPKLAICAYHRASHLWEIPLYLKQLMPKYKIFLRHHTKQEYETVCYAVL